LTPGKKEAEKEKPGSTLLKDFKYPPVLPMIFYDGKGSWTAERNFMERTHMNTVFEKYIPKFEYELINLNDYNEEEIMRFGGALSFLLLVNKARNNKEKPIVNHLPPDYVEKLRLQIPENMNKLLVDITLSLLERGQEAEQVAAIVEKVKKKEYGGMFEALIESWQEGKEQARAEGIAEGRAEYQLEVARKLLANGATSDFVKKITGLEMEIIRNLSEA
jgi:predicted transposase/invertase (TIGR01784 family)